MGFIRNLVLKTAIKKALLDVTEQIETFANKVGCVSSFGESVMTYLRRNQFPDDLESETWEGSFVKIIALHAQSEMPSSYLIQNQSEMVVFVSLIAEWVASKGGNAANVYREMMMSNSGRQPSDTSAREIVRGGRFIAYDNGTVLDTKTNLMWAAKDNGDNITWQAAQNYCMNYRCGGYVDWRMPTQDDLVGLYTSGTNEHKIKLTASSVWASEIRGSDAAIFSFGYGERGWDHQSHDLYYRALPVRSGR